MSGELGFEPHSIKQDSLMFSDAELTIAATGTQWGKSQGAAIWMKRQIHTFTEKSDNFLIMAPTYKIMNQSSLPYFLQVMEGYGIHRKADDEFKLHSGGMVYFRTGSDADSVVGIPKVRAYWLDEAGKATLYFWENIQARAAAVGARGLLTTSPYSRNWLYKQYIKPHHRGEVTVPIIQAASWENPYHTLHDPKKRAEQRGKMDPRRFDMVFGGEWGQMAGLVFDCFDEDANQCDAFQLPQGTVFVGGVDWGYTEPFVHVVRAITPDGRHYQISEFYKSGLTPHQQIDLIVQKHKVFGTKRHWCGHEQPGLIEELNRRGVPAQAANFDIMRGNGAQYELISSRKFKLFKGTSPHTIDEFSMYHYPEPEDLEPDENAKEQKPVGQHDHAMSANRFISLHEARSEVKHTPRTAGERARIEDRDSRTRKLMRPSREDASEKWND